MEEVLPIFASAAVAQGGLGLTPAQLAPSLSFGGVVLCVYALKGFPWLMRWAGIGGLNGNHGCEVWGASGCVGGVRVDKRIRRAAHV